MKKSFFSVCTAFFLLFIPLTVLAKQFPDVNHQTEMGRAIDYLSDNGVIIGFPDGKFHPYDRVTRGQAAKMLAYVTETDTLHSLNLYDDTAFPPTFSDIPKTHQYFAPIEGLYEYKIIKGYNDKTFKSHLPVTRAHIAQMISAAFLVERGTAQPRFNDVAFNSARYPFVQTVINNAIMHQTSTRIFSPNATISRGEFALFIYRAHIQASNTLKQVKRNGTPYITKTSDLGQLLKQHSFMDQSIYQNMPVAAAHLAVGLPHTYNTDSDSQRCSYYFSSKFMLCYGDMTTIKTVELYQLNITIAQLQRALNNRLMIEKQGAEDRVYYYGSGRYLDLYYEFYSQDETIDDQLPMNDTNVFSLRISPTPF